MSDPIAETGRPDDTWTASQKAEYEAFKAKTIAEMSDEPNLLSEPLIPMEDFMEELERLHAANEASRSEK